ncbi:MAG: twin-arginine translocase TatA/TatE family subunit, partial [Deltaproteobacteria bacterium]|nr:twin-arginine translocase TatA/TatE family subunit [Deltaproteobacteria bacterium]
GPWELVIIGVILFVLFGAKRIPEIGKGLGGAVREFRGVKRELSAGKRDSGAGDRRADDGEGKEKQDLESRMAGKVLEQVPGVRRAMSAKKKMDKVWKVVE